MILSSKLIDELNRKMSDTIPTPITDAMANEIERIMPFAPSMESLHDYVVRSMKLMANNSRQLERELREAILHAEGWERRGTEAERDLATAQRERESFRSLLTANGKIATGYQQENQILVKNLSSATKLMEELEKFTRHLSGCVSFKFKECDCGVADVLTRARAFTKEKKVPDRADALVDGIHNSYE